MVTFGCADRDLALRRAEALHVIRRLHGTGIHEDGATLFVRQEDFSTGLTGITVVGEPFVGIQLIYPADEVLADRAISYPLTRSMCAPVGDGAAAALVCSKDYLAA